MISVAIANRRPATLSRSPPSTVGDTPKFRDGVAPALHLDADLVLQVLRDLACGLALDERAGELDFGSQHFGHPSLSQRLRPDIRAGSLNEGIVHGNREPG